MSELPDNLARALMLVNLGHVYGDAFSNRWLTWEGEDLTSEVQMLVSLRELPAYHLTPGTMNVHIRKGMRDGASTQTK
jgi:hypothetical protein